MKAPQAVLQTFTTKGKIQIQKADIKSMYFNK